MKTVKTALALLILSICCPPLHGGCIGGDGIGEQRLSMEDGSALCDFLSRSVFVHVNNDRITYEYQGTMYDSGRELKKALQGRDIHRIMADSKLAHFEEREIRRQLKEVVPDKAAFLHPVNGFPLFNVNEDFVTLQGNMVPWGSVRQTPAPDPSQLLEKWGYLRDRAMKEFISQARQDTVFVLPSSDKRLERMMPMLKPANAPVAYLYRHQIYVTFEELRQAVPAMSVRYVIYVKNTEKETLRVADELSTNPRVFPYDGIKFGNMAESMVDMGNGMLVPASLFTGYQWQPNARNMDVLWELRARHGEYRMSYRPASPFEDALKDVYRQVFSWSD